MKRDVIRQTLRELLEAEMCESYDDLDEASNIRDDLQLDSVDIVGLILRIENRFGITIDTEALENIVRVGDLVDLIEQKLAAASDSQAA